MNKKNTIKALRKNIEFGEINMNVFQGKLRAETKGLIEGYKFAIKLLQMKSDQYGNDVE